MLFIKFYNHLYLSLLINRDLYSTYENSTSVQNKNKQKLLKKIALVHIPAFVVVFMLSYWIIGLKHAQFF